MAHAPPGHHSVVGRPSVGGLSFPEYVVYRGEQVKNYIKTTVDYTMIFKKWNNVWVDYHVYIFQAYPEYLINYQIVKPESNSDDGGSVDGATP